MYWPLSQDYNEAIQSPYTSFSDPELRAGEAVVNALGLPIPCSGNFADVYQFVSPQTQTRWAVKCFTREVRGLRERYTEISRYLEAAQLPFIVDFQYQEQGIRIRGTWYPILKMRWVEGMLLNVFVRENLHKPSLLLGLSEIWARMAKRLRELMLAHADLQHGNVILVPGSTANSLAIKLIDYDGMFVPALAGKASGEVGHPNYQHPSRLKEGTYSWDVDRFPLLVVETALRAVAVGGRQLWEQYDNGDNLLFREQDLRSPRESRLFWELVRLNDPQVRRLVDCLSRAAHKPLDQTPLLEELVANGPRLPPLPAAEPVVGPKLTIVPTDIARSDGIADRGLPAMGSTAAVMRGTVDVVEPERVGSPGRRREKPRRHDMIWGVVAGWMILGLLIGLATWVTWSAGSKLQPEIPSPTPTPEEPPSVEMKRVWIPPGKFKMGSREEEEKDRKDEKQHDVEITKGFWLGIHEVTQKQFKAVMSYNPSYFSTDGKGKPGGLPEEYGLLKPTGGKDKVPADTSNFPVENVSWEEAQEFCLNLTRMDTKKPNGWVYRLPREAEWEYACRGDGSYQVFHFGNSLSSREANFDGNLPFGGANEAKPLKRTCEVGTVGIKKYEKNSFGLYDMHGNVCEWCLDAYDEEYYRRSPMRDPPGPLHGVGAVFRGGSWLSSGRECRSAQRNWSMKGDRNIDLGFRVALVPSGW